MGCCIFPTKHQDIINQGSQINVPGDETISKNFITQRNIKKGEVYKENGNKHFQKGQYDRAINQYQKAIKQNPNEIKFYNNISVCFRKKEDWDRVCYNSEKALQIDSENTKSLLFYAIGLAESKFKKLEQAEKIFQKLESHSQHSKQAGEYLQKVFELKKYYKSQEKNSNNEKFSEYINNRIDSTYLPKELKSYYTSTSDMMTQLNKFISNYENEQIPQYFSDPIDFTIFKKPVISNTGLTYQSSTLLDHFRANGYFDPITKERVLESTLVDNKNLIQLISSHPKITKWKVEETIQNPRYINF